MNDLLVRARYAALKRHKKRQSDGLWCESDCAFHPTLQPKSKRRWSPPDGIWTFMYCDNVERLAKEGVWE
ncbi:hypothetical protein GCM10022419_015760 [Nonomuraea rosea]|uniref:Uncharacterized protein n=1 Tax=Nonomuraea rosea TaxID=638574 RepID=A0ABP6VPI7_9ACTN